MSTYKNDRCDSHAHNLLVSKPRIAVTAPQTAQQPADGATCIRVTSRRYGCIASPQTRRNTAASDDGKRACLKIARMLDGDDDGDGDDGPRLAAASAQQVNITLFYDCAPRQSASPLPNKGLEQPIGVDPRLPTCPSVRPSVSLSPRENTLLRPKNRPSVGRVPISSATARRRCSTSHAPPGGLSPGGAADYGRQ
jgi:hypothetical protein